MEWRLYGLVTSVGSPVRSIEQTEADPAQRCSAWSPEEGWAWACAAVRIAFLLLGIQECSHQALGQYLRRTGVIDRFTVSPLLLRPLQRPWRLTPAQRWEPRWAALHHLRWWWWWWQEWDFSIPGRSLPLRTAACVLLTSKEESCELWVSGKDQIQE